MTFSPNLSQHFLNFKPNLHLLVGENTNEEYCVAITWLIFLCHPLGFLSGVQFFCLPDIYRHCYVVNCTQGTVTIGFVLPTYAHTGITGKSESLFIQMLFIRHIWTAHPSGRSLPLTVIFFWTDGYKHRHISPELMARGTYCGTCRKCGQQREGSTS